MPLNAIMTIRPLPLLSPIGVLYLTDESVSQAERHSATQQQQQQQQQQHHHYHHYRIHRFLRRRVRVRWH
eukprot:COSAG06_NODE_430_length_15870_cov_101.914971_16_plen_70_part_00